MKRLLGPFAGAVVGGALAVVFGSAAAIREANDRAHQAREVAEATIRAYEVSVETIRELQDDLERLEAKSGE